MTLDSVKNFIEVQASTGYSATATSITLQTGQGAKLPTAPFNLIWWNSTDYPNPANDPNVEIVRVTAIAGDVLTISRAQESTSASSKNTTGKTYSLILGITAKMITDIAAEIAAAGGGGSGTVTDVTSTDGSVSITSGTSTPDLSVVKAPKLTTARTIDGQSFDGSADITVIAPGTHAATSKTTPVNADAIPLVDSAASYVLKQLTWANVKATLKTYFDTLYQAASSTLTTWASKTAPSGTVVGTTDTQVLSNKDLTSATNTYPTFNQSTTGNAATATKLQTARTIAGVSFDGSASIAITAADVSAIPSSSAPTGAIVGTTDTQALTNKDLTGTGNTFPTFNQNTTGNAATATALQTARTIAGVSFDGTANIAITAADVSAIPSSSAPGGSIVGTTDTQTVTNKRIEPRTSSTTSTATLTPDPSSDNVYILTAQAAALTIANPTGTPTLGEVIAIYVTDNGTAQTIAFGTYFKAFGQALPTTTTAGKTLLITAQYYGTNLWSVLSANEQ